METPQQPPTPDRPSPVVPGGAPVQQGAAGGPSAPAPPGPPAPPPAGTPGSAGAPPGTPLVPRNRRLRLVLALVAGLLALLCVGGVAVVVSLYDKTTKIDRGSPEVVANDYLTALLVLRDRQRARLSSCDGAQLAGTEALLDEITRREQALDTGFSVNVENIIVEGASGSSAEVKADIRRSAEIDGVRQSLVDTVELTVENREGWRVCAATKVS